MLLTQKPNKGYRRTRGWLSDTRQSDRDVETCFSRTSLASVVNALDVCVAGPGNPCPARQQQILSQKNAEHKFPFSGILLEKKIEFGNISLSGEIIDIRLKLALFPISGSETSISSAPGER